MRNVIEIMDQSHCFLFGPPCITIFWFLFQALENVFKLQCMTFDLQLLEILRERCRDTALSVRKQALDSLTSLLKENARDERVQRLVKYEFKKYIYEYDLHELS